MLRSSLLACLALSTSLQAQVALPDHALCPPDAVTFSVTQGGAGFGAGMAIDGNRLYVGAPYDSTLWPYGRAGAVYILQRTPTGDYATLGKLFSSIQPTNGISDFGRTVRSRDGLLAVASPSSNFNNSAYGSVEVFAQVPGGGYISVASVLPPYGTSTYTNFQGYLGFGESIELHGDRLLIGTSFGVKPSVGSLSGAVFEYQIGALGGAWLLDIHIPPVNIAGARFGASMASDGSTLVVGAPGEGQCGQSCSQLNGAAYVYEWSASTSPQLVAQLSPSIGSSAGLGRHVAVKGDRAIVGTRVGFAVYEVLVFERDALQAWHEVGALAIPWGTAGFSLSAASLALDGDDAFVALLAGYLHFRRRGDGQWVLVHRVEYPITVAPGQFFPRRALVVDDGHVYHGCADCMECLPWDGGLVQIVDRARLLHGELAVSIAQQGTQDLFLDFGLEGAGHFYFVLGSVSGTSPGIALPNSTETLPLTFDAYTSTLLSRPTLTITNAWGILDDLGRADAQFRVPAGLDASFAGLALYHAAVVLDGASGSLSASNAVAVELLP